MMKKVIIASRNGKSPNGGVERVVYYLENVFIDINYEVKIVSRDLLYGHEVQNNKWTRLMYMFKVSAYLKKKQQEGYLIVSNGHNAPFIHADVLWIHGTMYGAMHALKQKFDPYLWFERSAARKAKRIVSVSHKAAEECVEGYGVSPSKITVINNCVDETIFYPKLKELEKKTFVILFCGRLNYGKGIDELKCLAQYIELLPVEENVELHIATTGVEGTNLFRGLKKTKVQIQIPMEELNDFYNSGDVLYLPSRYEGFEMVTTEALSAGIPVVGYNVGAIAELSAEKFPGVTCVEQTTPETIYSILKKEACRWKMAGQKEILHEKIAQRCGAEQYKNELAAFLEKL